VLEHIEDDVGTLHAVRSHLTRNGWLVLTVPAFPFLWSAHDAQSHHFRRYTRSLLRRRVGAAGFALRYQGFFNFWLFPAVVAARLVKRLAFGTSLFAPTDLVLPSRPINRFLTWLFATERVAMGRFSLPFGVSLILSAQRKA
jgi:hypothetical protein